MNLFGLIAPASPECTDTVLRSFFARTRLGPGDRVVLVDGSGRYAVPDDLAHEPVSVLRSGGSRSFAASANALLAAARQHDADLVLLAGTLIFTDGWLRPLLADGRTLAFSVSNTQVHHTLDAWSVGPDLDLADCRGHEAELDRIGAHHRAARTAYQVASSVPFYCVRIPRAAYSAVGDFDEQFTGDAAGHDYALRAWRADARLVLALGSFVLRVRDGSSPATPQAAGRPAHDEADAEAFRRKWGNALTYAFLAGDWNLFRSNRGLAALLEQQRYKPVVEQLLAAPALDRFIERQQRATVGAVCCIYDDDAWLAPTVESVYAACHSIWFLVSDRPWNGEPSDQEPLLAKIRGLPDPDHKIRIVRGSWTTEADQRNEGLRLLAEAGIDYCFVLDADEIHDGVQLQRMLTLVRNNPQVDCWCMYCWTYWKSCRYRIDPPQNYALTAVVRVGLGRFFDNRNYRGVQQRDVPRATAMFHHMSYARTDAQVLRKITTFGHATQVRPEWYEQVWRRWDRDHTLEDLNPCYHGVYLRAIEQPEEALPPAIRDMGAMPSESPAA